MKKMGAERLNISNLSQEERKREYATAATDRLTKLIHVGGLEPDRRDDEIIKDDALL